MLSQIGSIFFLFIIVANIIFFEGGIEDLQSLPYRGCLVMCFEKNKYKK